MGKTDVKRRTELWLCDVISAAIPGLTVLPSRGGSDENEDEHDRELRNMEPPYVVVAWEEGERVLPGEPVYRAEMSVTYVTHLKDTKPREHSIRVQEIMGVLERASANAGVLSEKHSLAVSGVEILTTDELEDEEAQSHGDVIVVSVGVAG